MNVSSLIPWLSDFHTAQCSGISGYVLFLNLLLSFFWLCKEEKCIYLHLYFVCKSRLFLLLLETRQAVKTAQELIEEKDSGMKECPSELIELARGLI